MADSFTPDLTNPKAKQILEGARIVFLELGYEGASTGQIAKQAGVSKGTLYNYFPDKEKLFMAVMEGECKKQAAAIFEVANQSDSIDVTLRKLARNYIELCLSPFIHIYRLAVAEATRFPALARTFYDSGPDLALRRLTQLLAGAVAKEELKIDDLDLAAYQFSQLCKADLFEKRLFQVQLSATPEEVDRIADSAVDVFLRQYGK
ncbi:MAG: TetR/AcrR family transcriptional regulator C-terminal domain-containing protein [Phormidesmis sp.]